MAYMTSLRLTTTTLTIFRTTSGTSLRRCFHQTLRSGTDAEPKNKKSDGKSRDSSPKPKISNLSMPGIDKTKQLTKEQAKEVEQHNLEFEKKFDHGHRAPDDKVDKKFWEGGGGARQ